MPVVLTSRHDRCATQRTCLLCGQGDMLLFDTADMRAVIETASYQFDIAVLVFYLFSGAHPGLDAEYLCKIHIEEKV